MEREREETGMNIEMLISHPAGEREGSSESITYVVKISLAVAATFEFKSSLQRS